MDALEQSNGGVDRAVRLALIIVATAIDANRRDVVGRIDRFQMESDARIAELRADNKSTKATMVSVGVGIVLALVAAAIGTLLR